MNQSGKSGVRPLYLADSIDSLNEKAEIPPTARISNKSNPNMLLNTAEKVLKQAEDHLRDGDEERSYVDYMKYLNLISLIRKTDLYLKEKKHYNILLGPQKVKAVITHAEDLHARLQARYEEKREEEEVRLKLAELDARESKEKATLEAKKANGTEILNNNVKPSLVPSFLSDSATISGWELDNLMKQNCTPYLLFDLRSAEDYCDSRIKSRNSFNIPASIIKKGISAAKLQAQLPTETSTVWPRRLTVDLLILVDWHGEHDPNSATSILHDIMTKWDFDSNYKGKIKILEGGFDDWLLRFPFQTTNPFAKKPFAPSAGGAATTALVMPDFDYPDLDQDLKKEIIPAAPPPALDVSDVVLPAVDVPRFNRATKPSAVKSSLGNLQDQIMNAAKEALVPSPPLDRKPEVKPAAPVIDRRSKAQALLKYSDSSSQRSEFLQAEEDLLEDSLSLAKDNLETEMEWKLLCLQREAHAEGELRVELQKKETELLERLEKMEADNRRHELENAHLRARLEEYSRKSQGGSVKEEEQIKDRILKKDEERKKLDKEVEELRRKRREQEEREKERKRLLEEARRAKEKEEAELERRKKEELDNRKKEESDRKKKEEQLAKEKKENVPPKTLKKETLKDEPSGPGLSKLSRAHSTPNIAQLFQDEIAAEKKLPKTPGAQRSLKPLDTGRTQLVARYDNRQRNFAPVYGRVGRALAGLKNLGNTCYMNSIIQCLNNITALAKAFVDGSYREDLNRSSKQTKGEIAEEVAAVVRALWSGEYRVIACKDLKAIVGKYKPSFRGFDQQDSHEFLTILVDWLHEDLNKVKVKAPLKEQNNDNISDHEAAEAAWNDYKKSNESLIVALFGGQQKSSLRCRSCGAESATFEPFFNLSLPIPSTGSNCSLQDCFQLYTKPESVSGWHCPRCKQKREAVKQIQIWKLPPVLVVHLQRFYNDGIWRKKLTKVDFNVSDLNLRDMVLNKQSYNQQFSLFAISNHYGTMDGGHYTAYCRNSEYNRWYKFDDQDVSEISENEVRSSAAYIMFYTAVNYAVPRIVET